MTRAEIVSPPRGTRYFGVRFVPGAAALLIDAHASELADASVELTALLSAPGRRLPEQMAEANSDNERVQLLARYLESSNARLRGEDARLRVATAELVRTRGATRVRELSRSAGVSERQLERLFQERVGVRPKLFARVLRLQHAVGLLQQRARPLSGSAPSAGSQAELALAAGYADESHLLRDFRELAAASPTELALEQRVGFVQDAAASRRHVPSRGYEP
jgi:AraC-like DNA-binding protein